MAANGTLRLLLSFNGLNGATGDIYGNEEVWPFASSWRDWQAALNSPGAHQMTYFANLLSSIAWSKLIPDQTGTVFAGVV